MRVHIQRLEIDVDSESSCINVHSPLRGKLVFNIAMTSLAVSTDL